MAVEAVGFPLPVIVKGYACLTADEVALAKKNIDPARPNEDRSGVEESSAGQRAPIDEQQIADARQVAQVRGAQIVSYSPEMVRTATIATGAVLSIRA